MLRLVHAMYNIIHHNVIKCNAVILQDKCYMNVLNTVRTDGLHQRIETKAATGMNQSSNHDFIIIIEIRTTS